LDPPIENLDENSRGIPPTYALFKNKPNIYIKQTLNYNKHDHKTNIDII
jgi:hypothetical protein